MYFEGYIFSFAAWDCSFCRTSVVRNYFEVYKILTYLLVKFAFK